MDALHRCPAVVVAGKEKQVFVTGINVGCLYNGVSDYSLGRPVALSASIESRLSVVSGQCMAGGSGGGGFADSRILGCLSSRLCLLADAGCTFGSDLGDSCLPYPVGSKITAD